MVTEKININPAPESCLDELFVNVRFFLLVLTVCLLLLPTMLQADGLFDFQMKLAKKGNAEAQYKVGEMYETGFGVKKNMAASKDWITKSANQGHETAGFKLLYWDVEKMGVTASNKAKLKKLISKAKEGNPQAQYYIGKMHANGVGVKKDLNNAIAWLNKAAFVGVLQAERELTLVREKKQQQETVKRRAREKKRAELKTKNAAKRAQLEKIVQQDKKAVTTSAKNRANKAAARKAKAEKAAYERAAALQEKVLAQKKAAEKRREVQKQALLKKRAADKEKRKIQFESDPCSGKSARFLSTCR